MNREEVKIQFTATATGLDEIYKKINEIKNAPNIKLDEKLLGQLKDLETKVPTLIDKIRNTMSNQDFSVIDVQVLDNEFKQLTKIIESTITNLGKANLPAAIADQIEKARAEIDKAQNELKAVNNAIKSKQKKLDDSNVSGLNNAEASKVAKSQGATFELGAQTFGTNFNEYVKAYKDLEKQGRLTTQMQEDFKINTEILAPEFAKVRDAIQGEIDALNAKIPAIQQAISQGQEYEQSLKEQAASNESLSEEEKKVAQTIIDASNDITKAKTAERSAIASATEKTSKDTEIKEQNTNVQKKNTSEVAKAAKQVFTYGTVLGAFKKIYSTVISTITEMDKALTGMAVVTNMSREETWKLVGEFQNLAQETGKTTTEIAEMATKFYQQGKSTTQVLKLTEAAAKAATIAGIDGSRSIDLLTNAMNGFQVSASKAMEVSDKFAALAASAATDYEELATALSKVAAQANLAGMSMDFTLGLLTKGIEVTREAPETIGTALKTVIARMRELTDYGATLEDGLDVNRVAKALANVGVELMDENGQFRDLEAVLTEVGKKWDTLNKNQQANVAVALAGTRQQSRLIAMMQDFDRTLELVDISANSYGATLAQSEKYMGGLAAAQANLTTTFQGLITSITQSETIIGIVNTISGLLDVVTWIVDQAWIMIPLLIIIGGHLITAANTKLAELQYSKQIHLLELQQLKVKQKARKEEIKIRKEVLKTLIGEQKTANTTEDTLENKLRIAKTEATKNNNLALAAAYEAEIQRLNSDDVDEKLAQIQAQEELDALIAEENLLNLQIKATQAEIDASTGLIGGATQGILGGVTGWFNILSLIPGILSVILGLKTAGLALGKQEEQQEKKTFKEKIKSAMAELGKGFAKFWPWGVFVAAGILAAIGIGLAIGAASASASGEKTDDSIARTKEELNQLQAELYNLNAAKQNVAKLGDEFESLSNKIVKTNEDLERMNEIAQQINDEAGRTIVDTTADADTQLQQIRAYNIEQQAKIDSKNNEINETLGQGLTDAMNAAWWGGESAQNAAKDKYYDVLKNDSAFINSLRTVGMANLSGMQDVSAATSDTILDIMVSNVDSEEYFSEDGLDTAAFEQYVTDALKDSSINGYSGFIAQLDAVVEDGSMTAYANMLDKLGTSSDANFNKLLDSLKESNPMFAAVAEMGTDTARKFDEIGFSSDELNTMWDKLKKSSKALGKDTGKTFAEMAKNIEKIGDIDGDGVVSDLEARQAMYKQLVAEQLEAAKASQAIIDGTDQESEAAKKYNQNLADLEKKQEEINKKQEEINEEKDESNPEEDELNELEDEMTKLTNEAAILEAEIQAVKDAAEDCYANINDLKAILGITSAKEITEEFTKLSSAMERIANISDITSMSLEEQMNLLSDYPELLGAMERGYLTAAEAAKLYGETIANSQEDIADNKSNYALIYDKEGGAQLATSQMTGFENLFDDSEAGKDARQRFLDMGTLSTDDDWVNTMLEKYEEYGFSTKKEMLDYLNSVKADVEEYNKLDYIEGQLAEGNYEVIMSKDAKELWAAAKDYAQQRRNALESIDKELEYVDIDSQQYKNLIKQRNELLMQALQDGAAGLQKIKEETDKILEVDAKDEKYGWLSAYTGDDNSLSEFIKYENGVAQLNYEMLDSLNLTEEQRKQFEAYISTVIEQLSTAAEKEEEINDQIRADREALAQSIIDSESKVLEAQVENLEKRKEAYEQYFEEVDALEEEQERTATMQDITNQLAALSGGNDSATKALRKDLMSQLNDLQKEEEQARKEAAREALIADIDTQIDNANEKLDKVNDSLNTIIDLIAQGKYTIDGVGNLVLDGDTKPYATGGLVDYTGTAIVHGTPNTPEAFLSAQDTKNMQLLFAALNNIVAKSTAINVSGEGVGSNNITVENINISTNELNNNQDFKTAGQIFAEEFGKAIKQRGLNINVRK